MRFVKGKKYRLVKSPYINCVGCILEYIQDYHGKVIKPGKTCHPDSLGRCNVFIHTLKDPGSRKFIEHESMVKFCKKLRKERKNET